VSFLAWGALLLCLLMSAIFSGSETGFYTLSRLRMEAAARGGSWAARLVRALQRDESALLVTILVGNNLMLEVATGLAEGRVSGWSFVTPAWREIVLALWLTPLVFFLGELLPKDLFRRRPHAMVQAVAPVIALARVVLWPLVLPLRLLSSLIERVSELDQGVGEVRQAAVLELLRQGTRQGVLEPHAERLARNVLTLNSTHCADVMLPWTEVEVLLQSMSEVELRSALAQSSHSRLPVVSAEGAVQGYVHQLDVLAGEPSAPALAGVRPLVALTPEQSVDRALGRLRTAGQRVALVGTEREPLGLITLKDLVEEISGDLAGL